MTKSEKPKSRESRLSAMQRYWIMTLWQEQRWLCASQNELHVTTRFFAQIAGLDKLQQTQREQVYDLVTEGWLEVVPGTEHQKIKFYRLTEFADTEIYEIINRGKRTKWNVRREFEKVGDQPKMFEVTEGEISPAVSIYSVSGEPGDLRTEMPTS
jgi:hypothetical protein